MTLDVISQPERLIKIISTRYFLVIKEINKYLLDMILINYFRSGYGVHLPNDTLSITFENSVFGYPKRERYCFNRDLLAQKCARISQSM
jgi:hypothetical protein